MDDLKGSTRFHFDVQADSDVDVTDLTLTFEGDQISAKTVDGNIDDTTLMEVVGIKDTPVMVSSISYKVSTDGEGTCELASITDEDTCKATVKEAGSDAKPATCLSGTTAKAGWDADTGTEQTCEGDNHEAIDRTWVPASGTEGEDGYVAAHCDSDDTTENVSEFTLEQCEDVEAVEYVYAAGQDAVAPTYYKWTATNARTVTIYREKTGNEPGFPDFFLVGGEYAKVYASNK